MRVVLALALVLVAGCIGSSQARIDINGTAFEYEAPGRLHVAAVGRVTQWEEVRLQADPPVRMSGMGTAVTVDTAGTSLSGPISAGQEFALCRLGEGDVDLSITIQRASTTVDLRMARCA